jgi:regulator of sigma E protease
MPFDLPLLIGFWDIMGAAAAMAGIGGVIFFHEMGHFMVARWNGVRTEAFSLGFPPNGLRIRRLKDGLWFWIIGREAPLFKLPWFASTTDTTEYRIGLLPIGGYVKMAGEGIGEGSGAQDELRSKSVAARGAIFSAGVVMNVIFAVIAFTIAFGVGVRLTAPIVGRVAPGSSAAKAGLLPGDKIIAIDGESISSFDHIAAAAAFADATTGMRIELERDGAPMVIENVIPSYSSSTGRQMLGVDVSGTTRLNQVTSPALEAGVAKGDRVVSINGIAVQYQHDLLNRFGELARKQTQQYVFVMERPKGEGVEQYTATLDLSQVRENGWAIGASVQRGWRVPKLPADSPLLSHGLQPGDLILAVDETELGHYTTLPELSDGASNPKLWAEWLTEYDGGSATLVVSRGGSTTEIEMPLAPADWGPLVIRWALRVLPQRASPAEFAGVVDGDEVLAVAGTPVSQYEEMVALINEHRGTPVALKLRGADGTERTVTMTTWVQSPAALGLYSFDIAKVLVQAGPIDGLVMGWDASLKFGKQVINTISGIAQRKVSADKNLGGPLTILKTTALVSELGFGMTLYFLAILSVNLAILNVLPIPVLDGGHLFFLGVEAVRRRPVSDNIQIAAQYVGLLLLLALMVYVTINDIGRF